MAETADEVRDESEENVTWSRGDCIGHGAFGKVFLGLNTISGKLMAVLAGMNVF